MTAHVRQEEPTVYERGERDRCGDRELMEAMTALVAPSNYAALAIHATSVSFARSHVRRLLTTWGLEELIDAAELIVSELVTNSIKATLALHRDGDEITAYGIFASMHRRVWIGLYQQRELLVIEVWDCARTHPRLVIADLDETNGRGLQLVAEVATSWGYRWLKPEGKVVWAALEMTRSEDDGTGHRG